MKNTIIIALLCISSVSCSDRTHDIDTSDYSKSSSSEIFVIDTNLGEIRCAAVANSGAYRIAIAGPNSASYGFGNNTGDGPDDIASVSFNGRDIPLGKRFIAYFPSSTSDPVVIQFGDEIPPATQEEWVEYVKNAVTDYIKEN